MDVVRNNTCRKLEKTIPHINSKFKHIHPSPLENSAEWGRVQEFK